jgi:hypothetical protein
MCDEPIRREAGDHRAQIGRRRPRGVTPLHAVATRDGGCARAWRVPQQPWRVERGYLDRAAAAITATSVEELLAAPPAAPARPR